MARAASTVSFTANDGDEGLQPGRGGFLRGRNDTPWVSDPDAAPVKTGKRKGAVKRSQYGSPSGFGKRIESTWNLEKWGERRTALGIGIALRAGDYELLALCHELAGCEVDSDPYKVAADRIVARSKSIAKANLAADRGAHGHALAEDSDEGRDWVLRAEKGEDLGVPREVQAAVVAAWEAMLEREGLEILEVERSCVDDRWRLAGTLDRIARCTRPLRFVMAGGTVVEIPAGTIPVLDVKTGKLRTRYDGTPMYWGGYAVQVASYAQSVPYDTATEQRGEWGFDIDQTHALIAHLDLAAVLDGADAVFRLIYVDLASGRRAGEIVVQAKAWETDRTVFSVAALSPDEIADDDGARTPDAAPSEATEAVPVEPSPTASPTTGTASEPTREPVVPPVHSEASGAAGAPFDSGIAPTLNVLNCPPPDEGDPITAADKADALEAFKALPEAIRKGWWTARTIEAEQGHHGRGRVPYRLGEAQTRRRLDIAMGLIALCVNGEPDDEVVRAAVYTATVSDVVFWPSVTVGQAIGSMSAIEAARFRAFAESFGAGATVVDGEVTA